MNRHSRGGSGSGSNANDNNNNNRNPNHQTYGSIHSQSHSLGGALCTNQSRSDEFLIGEELVLTEIEEDLHHYNSTYSSSGLNVNTFHSRNANASSNRNTHTKRYQQWNLPGKVSDWVCNLQGNHPVGHVTRVFIIMGIAIFITTLGMLLSPNTNFGWYREGGRMPTKGNSKYYDHYMPFPIVDRAAYNQKGGPSTIIDPSLFHPALLHAEAESSQTPTISAHSNANAEVLDKRFLNVPMPTGAFWINLALTSIQTNNNDNNGLSYPVVAYPYAFKWSNTGLQASYPPLRRKTDKLSLVDPFAPDLSFSTTEPVQKRHITAFDPLSVTTQFVTHTNGTTGTWESYLVQGSPYITIKYQHATPVIQAISTFKNVVCPYDSYANYNGRDRNGGDQLKFDSPDNLKKKVKHLKWGVCSSSQEQTNEVIIQGVQFFFQTQEGLTWMVFASEPIALSFDTIRKHSVTARKKFTGVLRFALLPGSETAATTTTIQTTSESLSNTTASVPLSKSSGLRRLIHHAGVYPVGGAVAWNFRTVAGKTTRAPGKPPSSRIATISFRYDTKSMSDNVQTGQSTAYQRKLLMLSLPHHTLGSDVLLSSDQFDLEYLCIKGTMKPVLGDTWSYEEPLTSIGFDTVTNSKYSKYFTKMNPAVRKIIMKNVLNDIKRVLPTLNENVYGFGKQVARLAQLAHISNMLAPLENARQGRAIDPLTEITIEAMHTLHSFLSRFLRNEMSDKLLYDANFGGIVTEDGLSNSQADFGNGWYNDHHFHYGYTLYACAIMGKLNATFIQDHGAAVDALLFDVAYDSNPDSQSVENSAFFPLARHKAWFDGHSWASGLFPMANGKSQESSSEAVNCYYGAYLWQLARYEVEGDSRYQERVDFAKLLLATEIRGAKTYWHMLPADEAKGSSINIHQTPQVYNPTLSKNYMIGVLGMLDAVCSTWFGKEQLYIQMINFLPVTAITSELFDPEYANKEFTNVMQPLLPNVEKAWKGYVIADKAITYPNAAWVEAQELVSTELDSALSKSQLLHWISTRPGFNFEPSTQNAPSNSTNDNTQSGKATTASASCTSHKSCTKLGLTGACCPTISGVNLGCCD